MKSKIKEIAVGDYVDLATWKLGDSLYSSWKEDEGDFNKDYLKSDEIILPKGEYTLIIDYPLSKSYSESLKFESPVTREKIVEIIVDRYHKIYDEEEKSSKIKSGYIPSMYNRNITDGNFGIWGHDLEDLVLHTIWVDENNAITLGIDS